MSQTSYSVYMAAAYAGGHAQLITVVTGRNNSGVDIPYGRGVVHDTGAGTSDIASKLPSLSTDAFRGVALYDVGHEIGLLAGTGIPDKSVFNVVSKGQVFVEVEQAVTPSSPVFMRYNAAGATGTSPAVGKFRIDADTAKAVAMTNCRFLSSAAAGGLALLEVNAP